MKIINTSLFHLCGFQFGKFENRKCKLHFLIPMSYELAEQILS